MGGLASHGAPEIRKITLCGSSLKDNITYVGGNRVSGNRTSEITLCGSRLKDHATSVLLQRLKDRSFHRNRQTRRTVANYRSQGRWNRVGGRGGAGGVH